MINSQDYRELFKQSLNVIDKLLIRLEPNESKRKKLFAYYKDIMFCYSTDIIITSNQKDIDKLFKTLE